MSGIGTSWKPTFSKRSTGQTCPALLSADAWKKSCLRWKKRRRPSLGDPSTRASPAMTRSFKRRTACLASSSFLTGNPNDVRAWPISAEHSGGTGRRAYPFRYGARLHQGRGSPLRRPGGVRLPGGGETQGPAACRRQGLPGPGRRRDTLPLQRLDSGMEPVP